ncbi:MAG: hypothetical protein AABW65_03055 [Nanoarchaeota archaeon]
MVTKFLFASIVFLLSISTVYALEFNFTSPANASLKDNISITILSNTTETYDVKIYVIDNSSKIISEIFLEKWRNPFYFLKSVYPKVSDYVIRVSKSAGNFRLCVKLRKSGKTISDEKCSNILILSSEEKNISQEESNKSTQENVTLNSTIEKPLLNKTSQVEGKNNTEIIARAESSTEVKKQEKIILKSKNSSAEQKTFITKEGKTRFTIIYSFSVILLLIIVLLLLKRIQKTL